MKRLNNINLNTPNKADEIFDSRWKGELHYIDWLRFNELAKDFKGGKYLDIGCFNSPMPIYLYHEFKGCEVWGIDHAPKVIETLKARHNEINYLNMDITQPLPFENNFFDYIVAGELIEHLEDPQKFIDEMYRILKPNSILALSTPFEEMVKQEAVSEEHLWSYNEDDIYKLLGKFSDARVQIMRDSITYFVAHAIK